MIIWMFEISPILCPILLKIWLLLFPNLLISWIFSIRRNYPFLRVLFPTSRGGKAEENFHQLSSQIHVYEITLNRNRRIYLHHFRNQLPYLYSICLLIVRAYFYYFIFSLFSLNSMIEAPLDTFRPNNPLLCLNCCKFLTYHYILAIIWIFFSFFREFLSIFYFLLIFYLKDSFNRRIVCDHCEESMSFA